MKQRQLLLLLAALQISSLALLRAAELAKPPAKPNIVFALIDDFGCENVTANRSQSQMSVWLPLIWK